MPADRAEANQGLGKVPRPIRLLQKYVGKHCQEWPAGKTESEIELLIQENSKPQHLIMYIDDSVPKDQSR